MLDEAVHATLLYFLGANQISILEIAFLNAGPFRQIGRLVKLTQHVSAAVNCKMKSKMTVKCKMDIFACKMENTMKDS